MDPWSRRQQPIKVPKLSLTQRYPRTTVCIIIFGGGALLFSRFLYDCFFRGFVEGPRPKMEVDIKMLIETVKNRDPSQKVEHKKWREIVAEQDLIRAERRKLQEEAAAARQSAQE
ncbi:hypothetical protein IscW_ISCW017224 [Ixodes scapularis]|uniref:Uncharacterized protein n=1 Tax=Ixodes scapularis TaxID=6945 RepID=B7PCQ0_IXOSC|nr:hypothetical protein IscW_ISCW017224 [Ixodes scapularis]|eukprot:XP_002410109.1 hypothetical protein IscW_ISCW017224 [Ixodes scapularis]